MEIRSKYALKFTLGILLLSALAWKIDASKFLSCLRSVSSSTFLVCSILFIIAIFFTAYKWSVLLPSIRYIKLLALSFIGHFFSVVLPGQVSGEVVKVYRLGKERQDAEHIAASVLVDKLIGLISLLVVAEGGLIASQSQVSLNISLSIGLFMLFFIISLFCLKIPFVYRLITVLLSNIAGRWPRFDSIVLRAFRFLNAWEDYLSRPLRLIYVFFLGAVFQLFCAWINTLLAHEIGINVAFTDFCWIFGFVSIAVLLPISVGGIGVRESAFAGALSLQGVPIEKSIALSLAVFAISLLGALIGGLLELFSKSHPRT